MKLLSIVVPCYNSEAYMENCINSLLPGGEEVEIILVDDGSQDKTGEIADRFAEEYPTIVKAVHQENAGHGGALNTGLEHATGAYFKVVDSDDWVDRSAYSEILRTLGNILAGDKTLDMFISNYVYEKQGKKRKTVVSYTSAFPQGEFFGWEQVKNLRTGQYILMHSVIYRTALLKECGLRLPKHTFYVDNLFVYRPLPYVKTLYYLDLDFYRYFIGREDQSVNEKIMIKRVDQQIRISKIMIDTFTSATITDEKLRGYMQSYLDINMAIASIMLILSGTDENLQKKKELWRYLKETDASLYSHIRYSLLGNSVNLPGRGGRTFSVYAYKAVQKHMGFN